jgi:hypothetical protein
MYESIQLTAYPRISGAALTHYTASNTRETPREMITNRKQMRERRETKGEGQEGQEGEARLQEGNIKEYGGRLGMLHSLMKVQSGVAVVHVGVWGPQDSNLFIMVCTPVFGCLLRFAIIVELQCSRLKNSGLKRRQ